MGTKLSAYEWAEREVERRIQVGGFSGNRDMVMDVLIELRKVRDDRLRLRRELRAIKANSRSCHRGLFTG